MFDIRHESVLVRLKRAIETGTLPKELLICGPAGTGKTWAILMVLHCLARDYPNLRILFLRATRVSLTESVLVTFEQEILPADGCEIICEGAQREQRKRYQYPNGSNIVIAGLDRNSTKVLSTAWDIVFWNEAVEGKEEAWETLTSRMDRPGRESRLGWVIADTNPGSPDHWLKKRCEAGGTVLWETTHEANPALFDGVNWTKAGIAYLNRLSKLTGPRRRRLRDGEWVQGEGIWFDNFDAHVHVTEKAEYDPRLRVYLAIDTGVYTGAVWFQVHEHGLDRSITVFGDYLTEGIAAQANAKALLAIAAKLGVHSHHKFYTDPAGGARNPVGPSVIAEYEQAGMKLEQWPGCIPIADGLILIESFLGGEGKRPETGGFVGESRPPALFVHPRCTALRNAFGSYRRAIRAGQWMDYPEDPQHPHEDVMDALRGGLNAVFPEGRKAPPKFTRAPFRKVF